MSEHEHDDDLRFSLLRAKREWVPEWLWRLFCLNPDPAARLPLRQPWRALLTRDARSADEAVAWWSE